MERELKNKIKLPEQSGFTLVEIAVVLVVIGLILGAVTIGKDVQRNAEYAKIKQKFIDQWVLAYNVYDQRTGVVVGDSQTQPQMMVNGASYVTGGTPSGGNMTAVARPDAICHGNAGPNMPLASQNSTGTGVFDLRFMMQTAGVRMPPGRAEGMEDRYVYLDSNGNPQEIQVCFQWNPPDSPSGAGNVMVITGLTPDLARMLDQMIDGKADSTRGIFRQFVPSATLAASEGVPGTEWNITNQQKFSDAVGTVSNKDEDQVATVVAMYQMNQ
jgi:prepilin-type N-terminal cleavage/methylation domain-containing protein